MEAWSSRVEPSADSWLAGEGSELVSSAECLVPLGGCGGLVRRPEGVEFGAAVFIHFFAGAGEEVIENFGQVRDAFLS